MLQVKVSRNDFDKINLLLPDICPEVSFSLISEDTNLVKLGLCNSAPCTIEFNMSAKDFYEMLDTLNDIEVDAFNTENGKSNNIAYQKYLKYGCLYDILYNAERIYNFIGEVKYVGKSFGVESLTNNTIYPVIDIEDGFIRIVDDSEEDYLYSIISPGDLVNPELCGKWEIIKDPVGILKKHLKL